MALATLHAHGFAEGTVVSAYPAEQLPVGAPAPSGTPTAQAQVTSGTLSFGGLEGGRRYIAWAAGRAVGFLPGNGSVDEQKLLRLATARDLFANKETQPVDARDFDGVDFTGSHDSSSALRDAISQAVTAKRPLYLDGGTLACAGALMQSGLHVMGAGRAQTVLKLLPDAVDGIFTTYDGSGNSVDDITIEALTLDGDQAHSTAVGGATALLHGYKAARWHVSRVRIMNGRGYGFGWEGFPTSAGVGKQGPETDLFLEFVELLDNGAATNADGLDIKASERVALNTVYARGNADKGINIRGRYVDLRAVAAYFNGVGFDLNSNNSQTDTDDMDSYYNVSGCAAEGNTGEGFAASATEDSICHITLTGSSARKNLGTGFATKAPPLTGQVRATVSGGHFIGNGLDGVLMNKSQASIVTGIVARGNGRDGCRFTDCDGGGVDNSHLRGNTGWGVRSTGTSDRIRVLGNDLRGNTAGTRSLVGANNVIQNNVES